MDFLEDDMDILEIIQYGFPRRVNQRRNHYEEMDNLTFFKTFRLYKTTVIYILRLIENNLEYPDDRNNSISPINQLLCSLWFYASSGHLRSVANFMGFDVSTASRIIKKVSQELARLYPQFIHMLLREALIAEQEKFFQMFGFPRTIGVVDETHIKLQSPGGEDGEIFRNRKDVVARWPGSTHDATIFANSRLKAKMEAGEYPGCVLLGDSGYPLRDYFLTPLDRPATRGEQLYNTHLVRTRNSVERVIGLWKRRFPIMAYGMRLKIENSMAICIATAVVHNIARDMNESDPPPSEEMNIQQLNYLIATQDITLPFANEEVPIDFTRQEFINYFNLR